MEMTAEDIGVVHATWRSIVPIRDTFAELFYRKLLSLDPSLQPMFAGDMREQGRNFVAMISIIVRNLHQPESVLRALGELGARHQRYGVRPAHYDAMRTALMLTLGVALGETFTPQARHAWESAYDLLAGAMQHAPAGVS